jgi:hypothetical protein
MKKKNYFKLQNFGFNGVYWARGRGQLAQKKYKQIEMGERGGNAGDIGGTKGRPNKNEDKFGIFFKLDFEGEGEELQLWEWYARKDNQKLNSLRKKLK